MFTTKPNDVTVHAGNALYIEAAVNNAENVSWLHQGKVLSNAKNKIAIKFVNGKASLRIDGTTKKDEGDYTCLAKSGTDPHKSKEESVDFHVSVSDGKIINCSNVEKNQTYRRQPLQYEKSIVEMRLNKKYYNITLVIC